MLWIIRKIRELDEKAEIRRQKRIKEAERNHEEWMRLCALTKKVVKELEREEIEKSGIEMEFVEELRCPQCGSNQLVGQKHGFGLGKAVGGALLFGPVGLLGGFLGSRDMMISCMRCGYKWDPQEEYNEIIRRRKKILKPGEAARMKKAFAIAKERLEREKALEETKEGENQVKDEN